MSTSQLASLISVTCLNIRAFKFHGFLLVFRSLEHSVLNLFDLVQKLHPIENLRQCLYLITGP